MLIKAVSHQHSAEHQQEIHTGLKPMTMMGISSCGYWI